MRKALRFAVLQRDLFRCQYCGATAQDDRLEVDHIYPASKGGPDALWNLITACYTCNRGKRTTVLPLELAREVAYRMERDVIQPDSPSHSLWFEPRRGGGLESVGSILGRLHIDRTEARRLA